MSTGTSTGPTTGPTTGRAHPLSEFSHHHGPARADRYSRIAAGLLTGVLYALFAWLIWWSLNHMPAPAHTPEITAQLLPEAPTKRDAVPPPSFLAHLIQPRAETAAAPVFTIASGAPPQAPAPLAASAAKSSPMRGGTAGNGPLGQAASGNGSGGNGGALGGCVDPEWMRAVSERVRQFFYYPGAALAQRTTGVAMMHFTVSRDGQMAGLRVSKSSGDRGLDQAALDILQRAQPLPPMPDRMHTDRVDGELAINFGVRNYTGNASTGSCSG